VTEPSPAVQDLLSLLRQLQPQGELARRRRALLPGWIRFFSWCFLLGSVGGPLWLARGLLFRTPVALTLFGFHYDGMGFDVRGLLLAVVFLGLGTAAYGLLWGRSWGLFAGLMAGWGGLALSVASLFINDMPGPRIPLEPVLQVPFIVALTRRRAAWAEDLGDPSASEPGAA